MDRKWRRAGADTNAFNHTDSDSTSYSSRTAASDTRTSPDILSSVAGSRAVILAREGHVHPVPSNCLASGSRLAGNRPVTFLLQRLIDFAAVA